jgi:hypothetical protein
MTDILKSPHIIVTKKEMKSSVVKTLFLVDKEYTFDKCTDYSMLSLITGQVFIDGIKLMDTDIARGLFVLFMSYYAFGLTYESEIKDLMLCIEKFIMKWPYSSSPRNSRAVRAISSKLRMT